MSNPIRELTPEERVLLAQVTVTTEQTTIREFSKGIFGSNNFYTAGIDPYGNEDVKRSDVFITPTHGPGIYAQIMQKKQIVTIGGNESSLAINDETRTFPIENRIESTKNIDVFGSDILRRRIRELLEVPVTPADAYFNSSQDE